jgi:hypothetical protein
LEKSLLIRRSFTRVLRVAGFDIGTAGAPVRRQSFVDPLGAELDHFFRPSTLLHGFAGPEAVPEVAVPVAARRARAEPAVDATPRTAADVHITDMKSARSAPRHRTGALLRREPARAYHARLAHSSG